MKVPELREPCPLDNYLVVLARTVHQIGWPLRDDGWPAVGTAGAAVAFHLGRFIYHAARVRRPS